jgi:hypothetical protein
MKVLMPQDDYSSCAKLDDFAVQSGAHFVFTPIRRDRHILYPKSTAAGVEFREALTGYWEATTSIEFSKFNLPFAERTIDLGQRVRHLPPQFGSAAARKGQLALDFSTLCRSAGFHCDVSTRDEDVLIGSEWWKFLGNSKFTVGRLGGASIGDPRGQLGARAYRLQARKPGITRDQMAKRLHLDDMPTGDFSAVSPRLFEAAAMGVCQILEEDDYFEGFRPWVHYIPLSSDLSNVREVFEAMRNELFCKSIVENAFQYLIESGKFHYRTFVEELIKTALSHELTPEAEVQLVDQDELMFRAHADEANLLPRRRRVRHPFAGQARGDEETWLRSFRDGTLLPESFFVPWMSASDAMTKS